MKNSCLTKFPFWILVTFLLSILQFSSSGSLGNETDRLALLDFKSKITQDPFQILNSWNNSVHFCNWFGVSCNLSNGRVKFLNLESLKLSGSLPPSIGNLTYLTGINLKNNSFSSHIPQELGRLSWLQHLNLTYNSFNGKIPSNLSFCKELTVIESSGNSLVGEIPEELSSLSNLVVFAIGANNLTGTIPTWIGNFSSLFALSLAQNNFHGKIPNELGKLKNLGFFQLYGNYLTGTIPTSIYNLSSIYFFSVAQNNLHGELPSDIGFKISGLRVLAGGANNFTGSIPESLSNATQLQVVDFAINSLTGSIPKNLHRLQNLVRFYFDWNNLGYGKEGGLDFISSLANCTSLEVLGLSNNSFGGELPGSIANLSTGLTILTLGRNMIYGRIPNGIGNLVNLALLGLEGNFLSGNVPDEIGKLQNLEGLYLNVNRFSGLVPSSLGNLTRLTKLFMEENRFEGNIPESLGNCHYLQNLNISSNNLNGSIPKGVISLPSLTIALVLSNNSLTGSIPLEVGKLDNLMELDLSGNKLSGEIPSSIGSCIGLELLHLEGNELGGAIPESLKDLKGLTELDLSCNNLSGRIPEFLSKFLSLRVLNLSYNDFDGEISVEGVFRNASVVSVTGNDKLCGGVSGLLLPACSKEKQRKSFDLRIVIPAAIGGVFFILALCAVVIFFIARNSRKTCSAAPPSEEMQVGISYSEIAKSTEGFAEENLIGSGSFGSVYKGSLPGDKKIVAIKVLNLQQQGASKSFKDECDALRGIRHRNLLKIITACSSVDHQGNDFKALVFEFMPYGNLDEWLHPKTDEQNRAQRLSFIKRLNIAIDVASALDYLHHNCETPIVHCDLKPSNVLLDDDLTAHVGDFGLASFLLDARKTSLRRPEAFSVSLKGSIGYIPPEYGMAGQVWILGDVYSYGILLLEMFTGKRPTDDMFKEDLSIHKYVSMALPEHVMDVTDPTMLIEEKNGDDDYKTSKDDNMEEKAIIKYDSSNQMNTREIENCLLSILNIGLSCSSRSPGMRMAMNVVVNKLQDVRASYVK